MDLLSVSILQHGVQSLVLSSPSRRLALERAVNTTARPEIESEHIVLRSSLCELEVHKKVPVGAQVSMLT